MQDARARIAVLGLLGAFLSSVSTDALAGPWVRDYAVNWFFPALNNVDGDCPGGLNPLGNQRFARILREMNTPPEETQKLIATYPDSFTQKYVDRGTINGQPVNVYINPTSVPDPHIRTATGKYGYGFNLDGKDGPNDFIDVETGERGVDNMAARAQGCFTTLRGTLSKGIMPQHYSAHWETVRGRMPAWLIEIAGNSDAQNDRDVTVRIFSAMEAGSRDMSSQMEADQTFRQAADPRSMNTVHAQVKNGLLLTDFFDYFHMVADPYFQAGVTMHHVRMRFHLADAQGQNLKGIIGGYTPFLDIYNSISILSSSAETDLGVDLPGFYYALRTMADANRDPKTGMNMDISAAYYIEAVPAFITHHN